MKAKEKVEVVVTDDFYYDLFEGGYIDPEKILVDPHEVFDAMNTIRNFEHFLLENGLIEYR